MENSAVFKRRRDTIKKKARELSSLCNVDVCVLVVGHSGNPSLWPEDSTAARSAVERYYDARKNNKRSKKKHRGASEASLGLSNPVMEEQLLDVSEDSLLHLKGSVESKIRDIDARIGFLCAKQTLSSADLVGDHHQLGECSHTILDPMEQPYVDSPTLCEDVWTPMEQTNANSTPSEDVWAPMEQPNADLDWSFLREMLWTEPFMGRDSA